MKLTFSYLFLYIFLLNPILSQELNVFDEMGKVYPDIRYIMEYGQFDNDKIDNALKKSSNVSFSVNEDDFFHAEKDFRIDKEALQMQSWSDKKSTTSLQTISGEKEKVDECWDLVRKVGTYSGWGLNPGNFYLRADSIENNIINILFKSKDHIFSLHTQLPFPTLATKNDRPSSQNAVLKQRLDLFAAVMKTLASELVDEKYSIYQGGDKPLKTEERVFGFSQFWTEVKYNFAFFDQVPELDWDDVYRRYLPKFMAEQSNSAFYNLLEEVCALLEDGHTNIYPPNQGEYDYPPISLKHVDGKAIVQNMSEELATRFPKGTEITKVDGMEVPAYLKSNVIPYISSSTDYVRMNEAIRKMLKGKTGSEVLLELRNPDGEEWNDKLLRTRDTKGTNWALEWPRRDRLEFKDMGDKVAYLALNTFGSNQIVEDFEAIIDTFTSYDHYIIDLRNNGGGNSRHGYDILKYFADKPFSTSKWSTREHQASFKAWGQQYMNLDDEDLDEWQLKAKRINQGNYWYVSEPDTVKDEKLINFKGKLMVLIGNGTASAAEDFLIGLDDLGIGKLLGQATFGSTGQPMMLKLPRGGNARICTKKDTYPDGREFVGYGIKPDILIEETLEDYLTGHDRVLEKALEQLKGK